MGKRGMLNSDPNIHDFKQCLQRSHEAEDLPFWKVVYKKAFPSMVSMVNHRQDGYWQRAGIDRSIILQSSKQILIDEKVRGRNKKTGKVYSDIALEFISNDNTGSLGWVCKPLMCEYIAYAIAPLGKCYLLPVLQMQEAWTQRNEQWLNSYGKNFAPNKGYKTWFCPVPVDVLFKAIGMQLRIEFDPFEYDEGGEDFSPPF